MDMERLLETETHSITELSQLKTAAAAFAERVKAGDVVCLSGDLGAGKTTFTQLLLQACGVKEPVKSPTYTLYETYNTEGKHFVHMDLYRLTDPEELYFLGIEDLINGNNIVLVEWPQKGFGVMPEADWTLKFSFKKLNRTLTITSE